MLQRIARPIATPAARRIAQPSGGSAPTPATYATWDPTFKNSRIVLSAGDLHASLDIDPGYGWANVGATGSIAAGQKKCFGVIVGGGAGNRMIGFGNLSTSFVDNQFLGFTADSVGFFHPGQVYWNGSGTTYLPAWSPGDFVLLAIDRVNDTVTLYKNGTPGATIALPAVTGDLFPMGSVEGGAGRYLDGYFDPDTFPYAAPAGFSGVTV